MEKWKTRIMEMIPLGLGFFTCFLLLQLAFILQYGPNNFVSSILLSVVCVFFNIGWIILGATTLTYWLSENWRRYAHALLFALLYLGLLGSFVCDQYFLITHERLDEAFFLFDWTEIWMIADPMHRISWWLFIGIIILLCFPFACFTIFKRLLVSKKWLLYFFIGVNVIRGIPFQPNTHRIAENRFAHFLKASLNYYLNPKQLQAIRLRDFKDLSPAFYGDHKLIDPRYPLMHTLESPSLLASALRRTSNNTPPHIKIIIVESMSSDLFGQRGKNTGTIMPFMDSLSTQSLYFPNGFSTYQRTHNVLPAILASVPNTIDGNVFQQLPFPRHYSLFNLFQNTYFTRFYCGVPLAYLNMIGLMSHYQTDYHVKHWNSAFSKHMKEVGNAWGYPDEDLFNQAFYDDTTRFRDIDKPKMSVFLTISSHDPFIYPNKKGWEQRVLQNTTSIPDSKLRRLVQQQAASFGAFGYVDSTLSAFFKEEKKHASFKNTVYVITGDHGTELYTRNPLSKYNIPILIYSPLLKKPKTSQAIVSHNDIAPTLVNYLKCAYKLPVPDSLAFVGKELTLESRFKPSRSLVFTTNKLRLSDALFNDRVWVSGNLYTLDSSLALHSIQHSKQVNWIKKQLFLYQAFSQYTLVQNTLIDSLSFTHWMGNHNAFQLDKKIHFKALSAANKMTYLGANRVTKAGKSIRIELTASVKLASRKLLKKELTAYIHAKKNRYLSTQWTIFNNIRGRIVGKFKRNQWNRVVFSIEFNPKDLACWKHGGNIHVYLRNSSNKCVNLSDVFLRFYHNQRK